MAKFGLDDLQFWKSTLSETEYNEMLAKALASNSLDMDTLQKFQGVTPDPSAKMLSSGLHNRQRHEGPTQERQPYTPRIIHQGIPPEYSSTPGFPPNTPLGDDPARDLLVRMGGRNYLGPDQLSRPFEDALGSGVNLPEEVQRKLLGWVSQSYRQAYAKIFPDDKNLTNFKEVIMGNTWVKERSQIIQSALSARVSPSFLQSNMIPDDIRTVGDASRLLTRSVLPMAAQASHRAVQGELNMTNPLSIQTPTPSDTFQANIERYTLLQALWDKNKGSSVGAFFGEIGNQVMQDIRRLEKNVRGMVGLESLNQDTLAERGLSDIDPTEMPIMELIRGAKGRERGFRFNYLMSPGGQLNDPSQLIDTSQPFDRIPAGYKNLFMSYSQLRELAPWVRGQEDIPTSGLRTLVSQIRQGHEQFSKLSDRASDPVMYAIDNTEAFEQLKAQAIKGLPSLTDVGMYTSSSRDLRFKAIDPSLFSNQRSEQYNQPLMLTRQNMAYYSNLKLTDDTTPQERALKKRVNYILGQHAFGPMGSSEITNASHPGEMEDYAILRGDSYEGKTKAQRSAERSIIYGRYADDGPDVVDSHVTRPDEGTHELDYTPYGQTMVYKDGRPMKYKQRGTYVEGIDPGPRPHTDIIRQEELNESMRREDALLSEAANINPSFRQAIDNLYQPGGRGRVGKYWSSLEGNEAIQERRDYKEGQYEMQRAKLVNYYIKKGKSEAEAIRIADSTIAKRRQADIDYLRPQADTENKRFTSIRRYPLMLTAGDRMNLLTAGDESSSPINLGSGLPIELGSGLVDENSPFYAGYGSPVPVEVLGKRLSAFPQDVQKAVEVLMREYPEYVEQHLGKGKANIPAYIKWKSEMDPERLARYDENWNIARRDQAANQAGTGAIRWMLDVAGKSWEGYDNKRGLPEAQSQQPRWVGTTSNGKIVINPDAKLLDISEYSTEQLSAEQLPSVLALKSKAVYAHEMGHLRWDDLDEDTRKRFAEEYENAVKNDYKLASRYSRGGPTLKEEWAQQNMLNQMGGSKDTRWRMFQKENFRWAYDFIESIKDNPVFKKSYPVRVGQPEGDWGPMSQADPNLSVDDIGKIQSEISGLPHGVDDVRRMTSDQRAIYAAEIGVSLEALNQYVVAAPQSEPVIKINPVQVGVEPTRIQEIMDAKGIGRTEATRMAVEEVRTSNPTQPPMNTTSPPVNTTPPPAPGTKSQTNQTQPRNPPARPAAPSWVGPSAREQNFWAGLGSTGQTAWMAQQDTFHQGGINLGALSGYRKDIDGNYLPMTDAELDLAGSYANEKGYTARWTADPNSRTGEVDSLSYQRARSRAEAGGARILGRQEEAIARGYLQPGMEYLSNYNLGSNVRDNLLGQAIVTKDNQSNTIRSLSFGIEQDDGSYKMTLGSEDVKNAQAKMLDMWQAANNAPLTGDNSSDIASLRARMNGFINNYIKDYLAEAEASGRDMNEAKDTAGLIKNYMQGVNYKITESIGRGMEGGGSIPKDYTIARRALTGDALRGLAAANSNVDPFVQQNFAGDYDRAAASLATEIPSGGKGQPKVQVGSMWGGINYDGSEGGGGDGSGGGRSSGGQPPRRDRMQSLWNNPLGRALYGAYITKRFWSMTMGPEMMATERYNEGMLATESVAEAGGMGSGDLTSADSGRAMRASRTQAYYDKGSAQMWGGFTDVAYSFTGGSETLARVKSSAMGAMGLAAGGFTTIMSAGAMNMMGMGALAGATTMAGGIALGLGATVLIGSAFMEAKNYLNPDQPPTTWGTVARDVRAFTLLDSQKGHARLAQMFGTKPREFTAEEQAFLDYKEPTEEFLQAEKSLGTLEAITGEKKETTAPTWRMFARGTGGWINQEGATERVGKSIRESGYTTAEYGSMFNQYVTAMGYAPGTTQYTSALQQWSTEEMTESERQAMMWKSQLVSRYAGSVGGYFTQQGAAQSFVDEYGINNQIKAQGAQGLFNTAGMAGVEADTLVGWRDSLDDSKFRATRFSDVVGDMTKRLGPVGEQLVSQMLGSAVSAGWKGNTQQYIDLQGQMEGVYERLGDIGSRRFDTTYQQMLAAGGGIDTSMIAAERVAGQPFYQYQLSQQVGQYLMGTGVIPEQAYLGTYQNQASVTNAINTNQMAEYYGFNNQSEDIVRRMGALDPYISGGVNQMAGRLYQAGAGAGGIVDIAEQLQAKGTTPYQMSMINRVAANDLNAMSYISRNPELMGVQGVSASWGFTDASGNPNYTHSFTDFMRWGMGMQQDGNQAGQRWFGEFTQGLGGQGFVDAMMSPATTGMIQDWFGAQGVSVDQQAAEAWKQGSYGRSQLHASRMFGYQMAGIGVGMQQIAEQRNYLWGANQGGTWQNPAERSAWGFENVQRQMGYEQQQYQFGYQREMMQTQNYFAGENEQLSYSRMMTQQGFQRWQSGFERAGSLMQRGWQQQDWGYEDTMRQTQFGWNMEDVNENLRYAKGRDRKQLLKQRERMVATENMEEGQIDKVRSRQQEVWAREDERFQKATENAERMMDFDKQQFELSRRQRLTIYNMETGHLDKAIDMYEEQFELQGRIIELNREHQAKSLEMQEASLGIQAAAAIETENYRKEMEKVEMGYKEMTGEFKLWQEYDPKSVLNSISQLGINLSRVDVGAALNISQTFSSMAAVSAYNLEKFASIFNTIKSASATKLEDWLKLLDDLATGP